MYLSCTKGDLRLSWRRYVWVCVRNKFPASCNRFKSPSLPDSEKLDGVLHRSNWIMEYDGSDEYENLTLAMVTIVMLLTNISHVWHRLDANLEMNSYN